MIARNHHPEPDDEFAPLVRSIEREADERAGRLAWRMTVLGFVMGAAAVAAIWATWRWF